MIDISKQIADNFSGPGFKPKKVVLEEQKTNKKFVDITDIKGEEDEQIAEMKADAKSAIDSDDSFKTRQRKKQEDIEKKQRMEQLERMKKMRDSLMKQPDMDFTTMS